MFYKNVIKISKRKYFDAIFIMQLKRLICEPISIKLTVDDFDNGSDDND